MKTRGKKSKTNHSRVSSIKKYVKPGDTLVITTKKKHSIVLTVKQIQSDRLLSSSRLVLLRDIDVMKKKQINRRKSAAAVSIAITVVVIAASALFNAILGGKLTSIAACRTLPPNGVARLQIHA